MAKVKVWNDNVHDYKENFRGVEVFIKAKSFVEMEEMEAIKFRGNFSPVEVDHDGQPLPRSYKMIRIEKIGDGQLTEEKGFPCMACGKSYESEKVLNAHIEEKHSELWADQDFKEKKTKEKNKKADSHV